MGNYIYQYLNKDNHILYIGKTTNLLKRYKQHLLLDEYAKNAFYFYWTECHNPIEMDIYEKYLISRFKPIYNRLDIDRGECNFTLPDLSWNQVLNYNFINIFTNKKEKEDQSLLNIPCITKTYVNTNSDYFYIPLPIDYKKLSNLSFIEQRFLMYLYSFNSQYINYSWKSLFQYYNIIENSSFYNIIPHLINENYFIEVKKNFIQLCNYSEDKIIIPKTYLINHTSKYLLPLIIYIYPNLKTNTSIIFSCDELFALLNYSQNKIAYIKKYLILPLIQWNKIIKNNNINIPNFSFTFHKTGRRFTHLQLDFNN